MQRNINCLYIIKIAYWFMLAMPIAVLFYNENGLGMQDIFILQSIYSLSIVILEVPSGYAADLFGRKFTIITGCIFGFFGYLFYSLSYNFFGFLVAEILLGIGQSMISGADSAILYDSLMQSGKKDKYVLYESRVASLGNFAEASAGIIGGFLGAISLRYPYIGQAIFTFIAIPASIMLIEPEYHKIVHSNFLRSFGNIIRYALFENKALSRNILYSSVIGCATLTMAWFVQPFFKQVNIPVSIYGILWTILNFSVGITTLYAYRVKRRFSQKMVYLYIAILIVAGYWFTGFSMTIWGLGFIFMFYLVRGIASPILKDYINISTPSEMRATVLSLRSFIIRLLFAVTGPFLGWITDKYSLRMALISAGSIFFVLSFVFVFYKTNSTRK